MAKASDAEAAIIPEAVAESQCRVTHSPRLMFRARSERSLDASFRLQPVVDLVPWGEAALLGTTARGLGDPGVKFRGAGIFMELTLRSAVEIVRARHGLGSPSEPRAYSAPAPPRVGGHPA